MKKNILPITIVALFFFFSNLIHGFLQKPALKLSKEETAYDFNSSVLKNFSLGHKRLISSLIWTQTLLESDLEHYKGIELNSWMFLRFKTISILDPQFYENYLYGGRYLSIIKDDPIGAKEIYEKGLSLFPNQFWLNFNAAFNYYFELNDILNALKLYQRIQHSEIAKRRAPYLPSLVAKLMMENKRDLHTALKVMTTAYNDAPEGSPTKERFKNSLYSIHAEIDLHCLNQKNTSCKKIDFFGNPYILLNGLYKAQYQWKKFGIKKAE